MKLGTLLEAAGLSGGDPAKADIEVTAVTDESRVVVPGTVFVAVPGLHVDGHAFVANAVAAGAVALVTERDPDPVPDVAIPHLRVADSRVALGQLADAWHGHPSRRMTVAGITGTDGKTTTTTMLWSAWRAGGLMAASLGTIDARTGDHIATNARRMTTLEAPQLQGELARIVDAGCTHVALETSSNALALHRVDSVAYDVAIYTHITSEHLDLHHSWQGYFEAKRRLLQLTAASRHSTAVLDADDERAFALLVREPVGQKLSYSISQRPMADLVARNLVVDNGGVHFVAHTPWGTVEVNLRLAGRFNASNALAAMAASCATGVSLDNAARGVSQLQRVPGRMEPVHAGQDFSVVVDYAHTEEALAKVLSELRATTSGRLWVVFGSAGERDREKRPAMGAVAARLADVTVLTDEDPREEDREQILEEIAAGAEVAGSVRGSTLHLIADRQEAIALAISQAKRGDTVLLAGKGHESSILMADGPHPWDELAVAQTALAARSRQP